MADSAVLLVAHGSRVAESNAEIEAVAERLGGALAPVRTVRHAYLELAEPSISEAIDALVGCGVEDIVVIPYFLAAGRHVREDIPDIVRAAQERHPGLCIEMTGHFGAQDQVLDVLSTMAVARAKS